MLEQELNDIFIEDDEGRNVMAVTFNPDLTYTIFYFTDEAKFNEELTVDCGEYKIVFIGM